MQGEYKGLWSIDEFCQALLQDRELFFRRLGITHICDVALLFTASDTRNQELTIYERTGEQVIGYINSGPYNCAADSYDGQPFEPEPVTQPSVACLAQGRGQGRRAHAASPYIPA